MGATLSSLYLIGLTTIKTEARILDKKFRKQNQDIYKNLSLLEDDLKSIKSSYNNHVKSLLGYDNDINIRKDLDKNYHSDTPEINAITQYILEDIYPEEKQLKITYNIEDDLKKFSQISGEEHIHKISKYLNQLIENNIASIIQNEMDNSQTPVILNSKNNNQHQTTNDNENTLKFFN